MKLLTFFDSNTTPTLAVLASLVLCSCGSYQYVGSVEDSIYSDYETTTENAPSNSTVSSNTNTPSNSSSFYKTYFKEKSLQYENNSSSENDIFTDIDNYQDEYSVDNTSSQDQNTNYAGWGQNSGSNLTVNVYDNTPFFNYGWGGPFAYNWRWRSRWDYWGYSNIQPWGPYGYYGINTWHNPYWGYTYGYGYPHLNYGYYGYSYSYRGPRLSYSNGRRGYRGHSTARTSRSSVLGTTARTRIRTTNSSSTRSVRNNNSRPNTRINSNTSRTRTTRSSTTTRPKSNTNRSSSSATRSTTRSRSMSSSNRSSSRSRSTSSSPRRRKN